MKKLALTRDKFALVDDEDYDILNTLTWYPITQPDKHRYYAITRNPDITSDCITLSMHRVIMNVVDSKIFVDHIDGDGLNNQKSNLRLCTQPENARNSRKRKFTVSKYKGVYRHIANGKYYAWTSNITTNKKSVYLGRFPYTSEGEIEAAKAWDKAALKYHREFANLNFPKSILKLKALIQKAKQ